MLDNLAILLTCGALVLVAWRAIRLDAAQPLITRLHPGGTAPPATPAAAPPSAAAAGAAAPRRRGTARRRR